MPSSRKPDDLYGGPAPDPHIETDPVETDMPRGGFGTPDEAGEQPSNYAGDVKQLAAALNRRNAEAMKPGHGEKKKNRAAVNAALEKIFQEQKA